MTIQELSNGDLFSEFRKKINSNFNSLEENTANQLQVLKDNGILVCGVYTGDGADTRKISLGFEPVAVLIVTHNGKLEGLALREHPMHGTSHANSNIYNEDDVCFEIVSDGFKVKRYSKGGILDLNEVNSYGFGTLYYFIALRAGSIVEK